MAAMAAQGYCASIITSAPSTAPTTRAASRATSASATRRRLCAPCRRWSASYDQ